MNILITGANGQVGSELRALAKQYAFLSFDFIDREELDITDEGAVTNYFKKKKFDYCINCAAYTAVDKAEEQADIAMQVNTVGAKNLAKVGAQHGTRLLQLSTDYVYHNEQNTPFIETDATNPQGVYAESKLAGDRTVLNIDPNNMVIRTSWVYSAYGNNFVKTMLRLGKDRDQLTVIFDQIGTPTYAHDLAKAMLDIIQKIEQKEISKSDIGGIYHYSNEGVTSWYDFATAIFRIENINCNVLPIETKDYPTAAKRPHFSLLNKAKIRQVFGLSIPHWEASLQVCLEALKVGKIS